MKTIIAFIGLVGLTLASLLTVSAQFPVPIPIPSIPKIKKDKKPGPTPSPSENPEASNTPRSSVPTPRSSVPTPTSTSGGDQVPAVGKNCKDMPVFVVSDEDLQKTMDQAREYRPGLRDYYVQDFNDDENAYLKAALSPAERKEFFGDSPDADWFRCFNPRLDELAAVAEKTIGSYRPTGYTLGTPAEKNILKSGVTDLAEATVYNVGLNSANWKISSNEFGIPTRRRKFGTIWAKYPGDKYCKIIYVNLLQPYAGGGTYGASEPQYISWEFAGCPAGK